MNAQLARLPGELLRRRSPEHWARVYKIGLPIAVLYDWWETMARIQTELAVEALLGGSVPLALSYALDAEIARGRAAMLWPWAFKPAQPITVLQ